MGVLFRVFENYLNVKVINWFWLKSYIEDNWLMNVNLMLLDRD